MVNFDLRELSAPLEALRPELDVAYKRLDDEWNAVAEQLSELPIPCDIGYTFDVEPYRGSDWLRLEWRKLKGKKRICIVSYGLVNSSNGPEEGETVTSVTPYDEWGAEQRVNMLKHVPKLFEAAVKQTKAFIARTQE